MSDTVTVSTVVTEEHRLPARRVASIDVFRGLTMMVMIFVNELAGVRGLPWWTYHATDQHNAMTYVDMVFPFFLFIVGMSMPLAIERRLAQNPSQPALWRHIALRAARPHCSGADPGQRRICGCRPHGHLARRVDVAWAVGGHPVLAGAQPR